MFLNVHCSTNPGVDNQTTVTLCTNENGTLLRKASFSLCVKDGVYFSLCTCSVVTNSSQTAQCDRGRDTLYLLLMLLLGMYFCEIQVVKAVHKHPNNDI